jgi:hypothetical protein
MPMVAATIGIGDWLVLAGGLAAPYTGLHRHADDGTRSVTLQSALRAPPSSMSRSALVQDTQTDYIAPQRIDRTTI